MTTNKKMKKWDGFDFDNCKSFDNPPREGTDASDETKQFRKDFYSYLKKELTPFGIELIKGKPNYYDVTVVVKKENKYAYVSIGDVRFQRNVCEDILYRTMAHEKDWKGGRNLYTNMDDLPSKIIEILK